LFFIGIAFCATSVDADADHLIFSSNGLSPDHSYVVREPHIQQLKQVTAFFFKSQGAYVRQSEYRTEYGPLTISQHPRARNASGVNVGKLPGKFNPGADEELAKVDWTSREQSGSTAHGATWSLTYNGVRQRLDLFFSDSIVTVFLPDVQINHLVVSKLAEGIY